MRLIVLAAGRGERLMPLTRNTPKPLLDLGNGNTLIEEQLSRVRASGVVDECVLVTGYLADQVDAKLAHHRRGVPPVRTEFNPFFDVSNNLMSLWVARKEMDRDFMITNGDNLFTADVFRGIVEHTGPGVALAVGEKRKFDYDDMRVCLEGGVITQVAKTLPDGRSFAESPGLAIVRGGHARSLFRDHLELLVREPEARSKFWLELFNALHRSGVPVAPWWFDCQGKWQEVDFHVDVHRVQSSLALRLIEADAVEESVSEVVAC